MDRIYIDDKRVWNKQQKRIADLLKKPMGALTLQERLELIYDRYYKGQRITYEEYLLLLETNDEIDFLYADNKYQIIHESNDIVSMCITEYKGSQKVSERSEQFSSIIELLDKFRIEGKRIRDIWNEVT